MLLAVYQPFLCDSAFWDEYEWPAIRLRLLIYVPICFVALSLLGLLVKLARRWLFRWRTFKWLLRAAAFLLLLVPLFYMEEDWRGKRAWENYKSTWEAKGEKFDFASFIPPPVPDDQTFALAPVVASCYTGYMDTAGHRIEPPNTNVVNRLDMKLERQNFPMNSNMWLYFWPTGDRTDLRAWQTCFRTRTVTNRAPPFRGNDRSWSPRRRSGHTTNVTETVIVLATNEFPVTAAPQSPAEDVLFALGKFDPAIEELRMASRLSCSRFPLNYEGMSADTALSPHRYPLATCARVLRLRAAAELAIGQGERALADVKLVLYLANSIRYDPYTSSHSVQINLVQQALQPIFEGLAEHQWSDAQLAGLEEDLGELNFAATYQLSVRGSCAWSIEQIANSDRNRSFAKLRRGFHRRMDGIPTGTRIVRAALEYFTPRGWFYQNETAVAWTFPQALLTENETRQKTIPAPLIERRLSNAEPMGFKLHSPYSYLVPEFFPPLFFESVDYAMPQAIVDPARTACALERHRQAQGVYPESLGALAPPSIPPVPHDVINGQPLHYRRTDDGRFELYSVGWNETDDGGTLGRDRNGRLDLSQGDWAWPEAVK